MAGSGFSQAKYYLWSGKAPGATGDAVTDKPFITEYLPKSSIANGCAVIICPGGSYDHLSLTKEGENPATWLTSIGVTAYVLTYRLAPCRHPIPLTDAKRAVRLVRSMAKRTGIDTSRVAMLGFSAGGHLATTTAVYFDTGNPISTDPVDMCSSRPSFLLLVYPVLSFEDKYNKSSTRLNLLGGSSPSKSAIDSLTLYRHVSRLTPPTFIAHGDKDSKAPIEPSRFFVDSLVKYGVEGRLYVEKGKDHGFGMAGAWSDTCAAWMMRCGYMDATPVHRNGLPFGKNKNNSQKPVIHVGPGKRQAVIVKLRSFFSIAGRKKPL